MILMPCSVFFGIHNFQASSERIVRLDQQTGFSNLTKSKKKGKEGLKEVEEGEALQKVIKR